MEEDRGPDGVSVMSEAPERARPSQRQLTSFLSLGSGNEFACVVDALPHVGQDNFRPRSPCAESFAMLCPSKHSNGDAVPLKSDAMIIIAERR